MAVAVAAAVAGVDRSCLATDIVGIQPAALDQPRVNALIRYPAPGGAMTDPLFADFFGTRAFNIEAFFDTGASGVLISNQTASALTGDLYNPGIGQAFYGTKPVIFQDVGVGGADNFHVTVPIHVSIAPYSSAAQQAIADAEDQLSQQPGNNPTFAGIDLSVYTHTSGPIRAQLGPFGTANPNEPVDNPLVSDLDIIGMPLMKGKVVVMDPKPVENLLNKVPDKGVVMKTYVYDKTTPFKPQTADDDPGIPPTTRTIRMSYGSFDAFTRTGALEPDGTTITPLPPADVPNYRPTLDHNPFIGPNPVNPAGDTTPPVKIAFNGKTATGSFLLDTGAAASIISNAMATKLAVRVTKASAGTDNPKLETYDPLNPNNDGTPIADQFQLSIGGIGGTKKVPGFYLSSMLLKTMEGNANVDTDPKHFRFVDAPVLVSDISVQNPTTNQTLTLDGIFGMNNLVSSLFLEENGSGFPGLTALTPGAFDWVTVDFSSEANAFLKLRPRLLGDTNRDGVVGFADLVAVAQNYDTSPGSDFLANGDLNGDGVVNFADLVMVAQHYDTNDLMAGDVIDLPHYEFDIFGGAAGVPEPSCLSLLVGMGLVTGRRRRGRGGRR